MRVPHVDDRIRLLSDIPELRLHRGELGVVRSTWFAPSVAYEVEFRPGGDAFCTRTLLNLDQLQLADDAADANDRPDLRDRPIHLHD